MRLKKLSNNFYVLINDGYAIWFSYETPIGFSNSARVYGEVHVSENEWGRTTGKHINHIKKDNPDYFQVPHSELMRIINIQT